MLIDLRQRKRAKPTKIIKTGLIADILSKNKLLIEEKRIAINFDNDIEGKHLLNETVSALYDSSVVIGDQQFEELVVVGSVIIEKMSKLTKCGWEIPSLTSQLVSGVGSFMQNKNNKTYSTQKLNPDKAKISLSKTTKTKFNFREKYEAKHRAIDGHYVRSKAEMLIDNWLYQYGLIHAYEKKLPVDEDVYCDFYIPSGNGRPQAVYIEFWGIENDPKYDERKNKKIEIYKREGLLLIELTDADLQNLDDILAKRLRQFKVLIG